MENVTIEEVINQRFTNYELITKFLGQLKFYLKARFLPHSKEHGIFENRRELWKILFGESYPFSALPYKDPRKIERGQGILGEYVRKTTGHILTGEDLKSQEEIEREEEIFS